MAEVKMMLVPTAKGTIRTASAWSTREVSTSMGTQRTPAPLNSEKPWRPSCKTCSGDTQRQGSILTTISIKTKLVLVLNTNK